MKKIIFGTLLMVFLFFCFPCFGEAGIGKAEEPGQEEKYLNLLMEALRDRDKEGMYDLWVDKNRTDENDEIFEVLFDLWDGMDWESVEKTGEEIRKQEGKTPGAAIYHYEVQAENRKIEFSFSVLDTGDKIDWVRIVNQEGDTEKDLNESGGMHIGLMVAGLTIVEIGFSLYVSFLCVKNRGKWWGLWLAFILLVYGGISITWNGDLIMGVFVYLLAFPKVVNSLDGGIRVFLSVPVGAIWYFVKYNRMSRNIS